MEIKYRDWKVVRKLGSGSYGTVYEIERESLGHIYKAALKVISIPQDDSEIEEFRNTGNWTNADVAEHFLNVAKEIIKEFEIMYELRGHSNIVNYEDHEIQMHEDGIGLDIMLRMELLTPLDSYAKESNGDFTRRDIIQLGIDMCQALERCETFDIVHRDIKPSNIFVSGTGESKLFKLGDFGIAKTVEAHSKTSFEMSKKGTYNYMAPEIYHGEDAGFSVDQYSLGIVLYKLLNYNRIPFMPPYPAKWSKTDNEKAIAIRMSGKIPMDYPSRDHTRLAEIVMKACSYDPKKRYSSPLMLRKDLESIRYEKSEWSTVLGDSDNVYVPNERTPSAFSRKSISEMFRAGTEEEESPTVTIAKKEESKKEEPRSKTGIIVAVIAAVTVVLALGILWPKLTGSNQNGGGNDQPSPPTTSSSETPPTEHFSSSAPAEKKPYTTDEIGDAGYRIVKDFDENDHLLKETQYHADGTRGHAYINLYDEQGLLLEKQTLRADDSLMEKTVYTYDEAGVLLTESLYDGNDALQYQYRYESDGDRWVKKTAYNASESMLGYTTCTYHENGTRTEQEYDAKNTLLRALEYDLSDNMVKETNYLADGSVDQYCEIKYDYKFRQTKQSWYKGDGSVYGHAEYAYNEDGSTTEFKQYDASGAVTAIVLYEIGPEGNLTVTFFDKDRSILSEVVYDEDGTQLQQTDYGE